MRQACKGEKRKRQIEYHSLCQDALPVTCMNFLIEDLAVSVVAGKWEIILKLGRGKCYQSIDFNVVYDFTKKKTVLNFVKMLWLTKFYDSEARNGKANSWPTSAGNLAIHTIFNND